MTGEDMNWVKLAVRVAVIAAILTALGLFIAALLML